MSKDTKLTRLDEADTAVYGLLETLLSEIEPEVLAKTEKKLKKPEKRSITDLAETEEQSAEIKQVTKVIPAWGKTEFTALIVKAGGLKFAVPLVLLDSIAPFPEKRVRIPGQPDWHLGVSTHRGQKMVVVDIHKLLGFTEHIKEIDSEGYVLVVGEGGFGLHCDSIGNPVKLQTDSVKWSLEENDREWMAGVLPEEMCALLDIDGVIASMYQ